MKKTPVDIWLTDPLNSFLARQTTSGIVLFVAALVALVLANSPFADAYHHLWDNEISVGFNDFLVSKTLHHWINDGLMAVFFFVIGLELKREIMAGELSNPRDALLPIAAGVGGMVVPALIYLAFNSSGDASAGWGIPMATDIAFALGIISLLGNRVPLSLKVFLTALAIADDLGAVLVIAVFYTSHIDLINLAAGAGFMILLVTSNLLGVRNILWYGLLGIGGLWLAFLLSGVHATIAAVLAAFTIPANVKISDKGFVSRIKALGDRFEMAKSNDLTLVTDEQLHVLEDIRAVAREALTPLQRLEHGMHPFVAFVVMPVFALANAGISFPADFLNQLASPVTLGVGAGLLGGKVLGIMAMCYILIHFRWASFPEQTGWRHLFGAAMLASVGFTMSLFITGLAFNDDVLILQAKLGILLASLIGGISGYYLLRRAG
ncbi:Na+/H+ antiporter NhaA [Candidatus Nitrospira allomarina]|jgi:Na+:H+ antiporter, NhaA family|uniref:Na(+)/H(+) antiporter NhaA n=1 Tax=Candidatus Nitrospira allomarina TaxID=3020900 RepID=A0AA96G908_9BACT|nr:Na+/H+ antiporter NhaA [Candidatus Nitrospira allomarina]WNM57383.1 Na+/H+ antiporter NhaA [Candidatus Nitrospira allomarina]